MKTGERSGSLRKHSDTGTTAMTENNPYDASSTTRLSDFSVFSLLCLSIAGVFLLLVFFAATFLGGVLFGEHSAYRARSAEQKKVIREFLDHHPDEYADVLVLEASNGHAYMVGSVETQDSLDLLSVEMKRLFGEDLSWEMTRQIEVEKKE